MPKVAFGLVAFLILPLFAFGMDPNRCGSGSAFEGFAIERYLFTEKNYPSSVILSEDGSRLLIGTWKGEVIPFSAHTLKPLNPGQSATNTGSGKPAILTNYGQRILGVTGKTLFELEGNKLRPILELPAEAHAIQAAEDYVAVAVQGARVRIYQAGREGSLTLKLARELTFPGLVRRLNPFRKDTVYSMAISRDGKTLATTFDSGKQAYVYVWDLQTGKSLFHRSTADLNAEGARYSYADGAQPRCNALHFNDDGSLYTGWTAFHSTTGEWIESVFVWDGTDGKLKRSFGHRHAAGLQPSSGEVKSLTAEAKGSLVAVGRSGSHAGWTLSYRWEVHAFLPKVTLFTTAGVQVAHLVGHQSPIGFTVFSPDGQQLYSVAVDGEIIRWNLKSVQSSNGRAVAGPVGTNDSFLVTPTRGRYVGYVIEDSE